MNPLQRLRFLFRRDQLDREMDEEMRFHLEMQARENAEAGVPGAESEHLARRQFGRLDGVKETVRERRTIVWFEQIARDVRFAARSLRRSLGFTASVVVTLAIAIGLVTAIVNVSRQVLLPDLPYPESDRLVILREREPGGNGYYMLPFRFTAYSDQTSSLTALGADSAESLNLVVNKTAHAVPVSCVTPGYFAALGVSCSHGRTFLSDEHLPGTTGTVAVISHQAWTRYFNRDPSIVGKDILVGDRPRRVVGILGERFHSLLPRTSGTDGIYLPTEPATVPERLSEVSYVTAVGRLKPSFTLEQAQAELRTIEPAMPSGSGPPFTELEPFLLPLADAYRERHAQPFRLFLGAAGFLYLIGCTAVANLVVTRTMGRRRELGVRLALGGGRRRIMALMFAEACLLALAGAAGGALIAWWSQRFMVNLLPEGFRNGAALHGFDIGTITVAAVLGVVTCMLAGLLPAWRAGRTNLNESLKEGPGALGESRRLRFTRGALVAVQAALAVALLIGAGLMIQSVYRIQKIELGFDPGDKIVFSTNRQNVPERERLRQLNDAIVERLGSLPEVASAGETSTVPLGAGWMVTSSFKMEGRDESEAIPCFHFSVSPDYFAAMDLPLIAGSGFLGLRGSERRVAIIDEITARKLFPDETPIGRSLVYDDEQHEIVGVVGNIAVNYHGTVAMARGGDPILRELYIPTWQSRPSRHLSMILRITDDPGPNFAAAVRQAVYEIDPSAVVALRPLADVIAERTRAERHTGTMLQILSALALLLATFGLFSVMAYTVAQRRGELGLRMVLGATPGRLVAFVLERGLWLATLGIVLGIGTAIALTRFMQSLLYETSPHAPEVYTGVAMLLLIATVLACWLPARRAAKIDPAITLRAE